MTQQTLTRRARVEAIRDGAIVREALGLAARHSRTKSGQHVVSWFDQSAGRPRTSTGPTLAEAIAGAEKEYIRWQPSQRSSITRRSAP